MYNYYSLACNVCAMSKFAYAENIRK
ncbi:hypothetical protein AALD74_26130 [Lachnospiraceae bacterium 48-21]